MESNSRAFIQLAEAVAELLMREHLEQFLWSDSSHIELMDQVAKHFFRDHRRMLADAILLDISRLLDNKRGCGFKGVIRQLPVRERDALESRRSSIAGSPALKEYRDQFLAHEKIHLDVCNRIPITTESVHTLVRQVVDLFRQIEKVSLEYQIVAKMDYCDLESIADQHHGDVLMSFLRRAVIADQYKEVCA